LRIIGIESTGVGGRCVVGRANGQWRPTPGDKGARFLARRMQTARRDIAENQLLAGNENGKKGDSHGADQARKIDR
jgi:hypothetical protein